MTFSDPRRPHIRCVSATRSFLEGWYLPGCTGDVPKCTHGARGYAVVAVPVMCVEGERFAGGTNDQSRKTTLRRELLIFRPPLYSMKPSFRNLFMKKFTRERVVPTISASVSCDTLGSVR